MANNDVVPLLQQLIRNQCVNDGTKSSGNETRNAETLRAFLTEGASPDEELIEPIAGRGSLIARIEGSDPSAPSLCLMGHTDVVPANPDTWRNDPFGGEVIDGEVWGRGAVDMLNQTAAMAVAFRNLTRSGFKPKGTLVYLAAADEEAGGRNGVGALVEGHADAVLTTYCLTEVGGMASRRADGRTAIAVGAAEKGTAAVRLNVRGTAAHGSSPYGSDNALVTASEVVRRIAGARGPGAIEETWRGWVLAQGYDDELTATLLDADRVWDALPTMSPAMARNAHACTHLTAAPTMVTPGPAQKINTIPDVITIGVDVRTLPSQGEEETRAFIDEALGDLADRVTYDFPVPAIGGTTSPTGTPLWAAMEAAARRTYPEAVLLPSMIAGATDARYLRPRGVTTYGFGLLSTKIEAGRYWAMFHGKNERIDLESLDLSVDLWEGLSRDFLG